MVALHLHLRCRDAPDRAGQIELFPLGGPNLTGSRERINPKQHRRSCDHLTLVSSDGSHQGSDCPRLLRRGVMLYGPLHQCVGQVCGRVGVGQSTGNREPEHTAYRGSESLRRLLAPFDLTADGQHVGRPDVLDGICAEAGECVGQGLPVFPQRGRADVFPLAFFHVGVGDGLERVVGRNARCCLTLATNGAGVLPLRDLQLGCVTSTSRLGQSEQSR